MAIRMFAIPFDSHQEVFHDDDLQKFLLNKQVRTIQSEFFRQHDRAYWAIYIEYDAVLKDAAQEADTFDEPQRLLFKRFREWRREKAEQQGFPVFLIATNRELRDLVTQAPRSVQALQQIRGFGKKKVERYGQEILELIRAFYEKTAETERKSA
jgi:superfamily II DNA helicase RecQ